MFLVLVTGFKTQTEGEFMNPFGGYKPRVDAGISKIEPTFFVIENWPLLCQIAEVDPVPKLTVLHGAEPDFLYDSDTTAMFYRSDTDEIVLNDTDLKIDSHALAFKKMNLLGMLWGVPAAMIRVTLFNRKQIQESQRLGMVIARKAKWPRDLVSLLRKSVAYPEGSEEFRRRCDILIIQGAVQKYMQSLALDTEVDSKRLHDIIWSQRDSLNMEFFEL